jgi:hypothetical protein
MKNTAKVREILRVGKDSKTDHSWIGHNGSMAFDMLVELEDLSEKGLGSFWRRLPKVDSNGDQLVLATAYAFPEKRDGIIKSLISVLKDDGFSS